MRSDLDRLPEVQQAELARIVATLKAEFDKAVAGGTQPFRRNAKILKIVLFGSYARGDFVDEPQNGYRSDFDLLVIVNDDKLTDVADYWWTAEDQILHDPQIGRTVNLIVHSLREVNEALAKGQYFFSEIVRDGVALYELPGHPLASCAPADPLQSLDAARSYFNSQLADLDLWIDDAARHIVRAEEGPHLRKRAAFLLHQATETAYACFLLVRTLYFPRSHNIKFLRSLAEAAEPRLIAAWPRETKLDRRRFELLKRAYVEARYSAAYAITAGDLDALAISVCRLRDVVEYACQERIAELDLQSKLTP